MKDDDYATRKELDIDCRLTKVETSERLFRWFFGVTLAVLVAALIGIFTVLFELQYQMTEARVEIAELNSRMDSLETRVGNIESYMKLNGSVPRQE